jgi:hypothetical protein
MTNTTLRARALVEPLSLWSLVESYELHAQALLSHPRPSAPQNQVGRQRLVRRPGFRLCTASRAGAGCNLSCRRCHQRKESGRIGAVPESRAVAAGRRSRAISTCVPTRARSSCRSPEKTDTVMCVICCALVLIDGGAPPRPDSSSAMAVPGPFRPRRQLGQAS